MTAQLNEFSITQKEKEIFVLTQKLGSDTEYNITLNVEIKGKLNYDKLNESIIKHVQIHKRLRSIYSFENGLIIRKIINDYHIPLNKIAITPDKKLDSVIRNFKKPFNLSKFPLFRTLLIELKPERHFLLFDFHCLIFNKKIQNHFIRDLFDIYFIDKSQEKLRVHYSDIAYWQKSENNSEEIFKQKEYWLKTLSGPITPTNISTDFSRPPILNYKGAHVNFSIDSDRYNNLINFSRRIHADPSMVIFAIFNILISKASGKEDLIIGFPVFGKMSKDTVISKHLSFIINRLPIRNKISKDKTFLSLLDEIKHSVLSAFRNQNYPISELFSQLDIEHDPSYAFLFNIAFSWFNKKVEKRMHKSAVGSYVFDNRKILFDIFLKGIEAENEFKLSIEYSTYLYRDETIIRLKERILCLLDSIIENSNRKINDIELFLDKEKDKILNEFNDTGSCFPKDKTIIDIFEQTAEINKYSLSVIFQDKEVTYQELNERANKLAWTLLEKKIRKGDIAGILLKPGIDMIISIVGILKTGAAYLPIASEYPKDRIEYMLIDSSSKILITSKSLIPNNNYINFKAEILYLNDTDLLNKNSANINTIISPDDLAYLIYTSGSTGKPKGVMIKHTSLVNLCMWHINEFNVTENDNCTKYAGVAFDASVWEIFPTLFAGATLHVIPEDIKLNIGLLNEYYNKNKISISFLPTQFAEIFMTTDTPYLKTLLIGGDKLKNFVPKPYSIINAYGPTEATILATMFYVDKKYGNIPIGKPISNYKIYIVDDKNNLKPIGFSGEICISGIGLAEGYLNRKELTKEKFLQNPFATDEQKILGYDRLYRTGDLGRWLPDGNIEYLGRSDFQVKIRGYRIEVGEIENKIKAFSYIKENAVIARTSKNEQKYLCAFYTKKENFDINILKRTLSKSLPEYMIPASFIEVDKIPITANGKVDSKKLDQYEEGFIESEYLPPINDSEKIICNVWSKILGVKTGRISNFFLSGGNSIKAIAAVSELQKDFDISINSIFEHQTPRALSKQIKQKTTNFKESLNELKIGINTLKKELSEFRKSRQYNEIINSYSEKNKEYENIDLNCIKEYQNIMLTGGTGYLGSFIIYYIFKTTKANIYLPVRGKDKNDSIGRLKHKLSYYFGNEIIGHPEYAIRVQILNSDLEKPKLGLGNGTYCALSDKIDVIIHAAANVSHYGEYQKYYATNVLSTLNLLKFAAERKKKDFNYISTRDVVEQGYIEDQKFHVLSEYDSVDNLKQEYPNNYIKTKYEAENAVITARKQGITTNIFRLGNLVFDTEKGKYQENISTNAFFILLKAFVKTGIINNLIDKAELSYIDTTVKGILALYNRKNLKNEIYHLYNFKRERLSNILMDKFPFLKLKHLDFDRFIDEIYILYDDPNLNSYVRDILTHFGFFDQQNSTEFEVLTEKTEYLLKRCNIIWKPLKNIGFDKMHRMLAEALNSK